jgi:hypothetical protein
MGAARRVAKPRLQPDWNKLILENQAVSAPARINRNAQVLASAGCRLVSMVDLSKRRKSRNVYVAYLIPALGHIILAVKGIITNFHSSYADFLRPNQYLNLLGSPLPAKQKYTLLVGARRSFGGLRPGRAKCEGIHRG